MRAATLVQVLQFCRTYIKFYCMFYFTCDRSFTRPSVCPKTSLKLGQKMYRRRQVGNVSTYMNICVRSKVHCDLKFTSLTSKFEILPYLTLSYFERLIFTLHLCLTCNSHASHSANQLKWSRQRKLTSGERTLVIAKNCIRKTSRQTLGDWRLLMTTLRNSSGTQVQCSVQYIT